LAAQHAAQGMMELPSHIDFGERSALPAAATLPSLRIRYEHADATLVVTEPDVLAVIGFGGGTAQLTDPGYLRVGLEPLLGSVALEVWRGRGGVERGRDGAIRWSSDGDYTFAAIEVEEVAHGGIADAARHAYETMQHWCGAGRDRHILRIWHYLDAINAGTGDAERYRQFCSGRALGMDGLFSTGYPAATAIGAHDGRRMLQMYWLAARKPGAPIENPRQLSAWQYPRRYGPSAPNFVRAMRGPTQPPQIYISGTAAIIGHVSHHADDSIAQLEETLTNLDSLLATARIEASARLGARSALKVYVRHAADAATLYSRLRERVGADTPLLLLHGDICRAELLVEIEGVQDS
jgi:chorismate lyase / 3-hydroxybenzoate synthase